MSRSPKRKLAASFVVTISAIPVAASVEGCRKTPLDPDKAESHSVYRNGDHCLMDRPTHCPRGATCNPPGPTQIDCPPSHRDAGEPDPRPERPPGKEGWLRVQPSLYASTSGCAYSPERFCSPPGTPIECTSPGTSVTLKCQARDGGAPFAIEPFTYKDGLGICHKIPALECSTYDCEKTMPPGEITPCP